MTDLTKAIELAEKASKQLQKSHVKAYTRKDGTVVQEHDDSRRAKELSDHASKMSDTAKEKGDIVSHNLASDAHTRAISAHNLAKNYAKDKEEYQKHSDAIAAHQQASKQHASEAARIHRDRTAAVDEPARQFKKGDKAKDEYGTTHTVIEQRGTSVKTAQSGSNWIHASKLWHHQE